jgi:hypothetical protein
MVKIEGFGMPEVKKGRKEGSSDIARRLSVGLSSHQAKLLATLEEITRETASGLISRLFEKAAERELVEIRREARTK